jgi:peptidoglycan/LPS O-acetylase OafA/YrhL
MQNRPRLDSLTGLRFFAAFHVFLHHFTRQIGLEGPVWLLRFFDSGQSGVTLFFILSGFILSFTYLENWSLKWSSLHSFWIARLARIYPVYVFALFVSAPLYLMGLSEKPVSLQISQFFVTAFYSLALSQAWGPPSLRDTWNAPGWSLSAELFFYAIFPALAIVVQRMNQRTTINVLLGAWIWSVLPGIMTFVILNANVGSGASDYDYSLPIARLPEFVVGVALGKLFLLQRGFVPLAWVSRLLPLFSLVALCLWFAFIGMEIQPGIQHFVLVPLYCALIYSLALGGGALGRFLGQPLLVLLGGSSYALYLLHWSAIHGWLALEDMGFQMPHRRLLVAMSVFILLVSVLVFRWFEEPARKLIRDRFTKIEPTTSES